MKKSKKSREQPSDRLSELPDSIIFEIFWLLPMKEVVRTTILSKRWNNLWKTTPYLDFHDHALEFINRALLLWKGLKILKIKFGCVCLPNKSGFSDLDVWVSLARENGVEEFYLDDIIVRNNGDTESESESYCVPHNLYSCSSLKVLSLRYCNLEIHGNVQLNQLRSLTIEECDVDAHSINHVVSSCPQLEVFMLVLLNSYDNLSIQSSCLKKLEITRTSFNGAHSSVSELRIWSPNLETLHLIGEPHEKYSLVNVSSLTHLTIDFDFSYEISEDILGEILWQIFQTMTIKHVEKVTLQDWCIKVLLGYMKDKYSISPSSNLKSLTIKKECTGDYEQIVDILQIFPELKTLVLQYDWFYFFTANHVGSLFHYEKDLPESFLQQLRTIEIKLTEVDDLIFPFIEMLLKHASKLQKMAIRVRAIKPPSTALILAQKLLRMPRSSPTAELIFAEY